MNTTLAPSHASLHLRPAFVSPRARTHTHTYTYTQHTRTHTHTHTLTHYSHYQDIQKKNVCCGDGVVNWHNFYGQGAYIDINTKGCKFRYLAYIIADTHNMFSLCWS